jgi:hypothetical protein
MLGVSRHDVVMESRVLLLLSGSLAMAYLNLQFINYVMDTFVVKTNVSISHGLQCPDYTILKEDKTELFYKR